MDELFCGNCHKKLDYEKKGSYSFARCCGRKYSVLTVDVDKKSTHGLPTHRTAFQNEKARCVIDRDYTGTEKDPSA